MASEGRIAGRIERILHARKRCEVKAAAIPGAIRTFEVIHELGIVTL